MTNASGPPLPDRTAIRKWAKLRLWAGYIFIAFVLVFARPQLPWVIVGTILILIGIALRLIASATLVKDSILCTSGIYAVSRNPLYLGSSLIGLGFASLASSLWFVAAFLIILVPLYWRMIVLEEEYLLKLYPESFPEYRKSVPAFLPRLSAAVGLFSTLDFARLKSSREATSALLIAVIMLALLIIHPSWFPR
jgi:protein-S-isoprenylcysteine O-methyltransferase Ste14